MERHELLEMMGELQLSGMKAAFDEVLREALRCGHAVQRILGDLYDWAEQIAPEAD